MSAVDFSPEKVRMELVPVFERPEVRLVVLFGSRVSGRLRRSSDLDLAVLADHPIDSVDLTNSITQLLHFPDVDVVDLARCSPTLAMVVATRGKVLYERALGDFASFCSLSLRRYEDARKMRAAQKEAILNFLRRRGL